MAEIGSLSVSLSMDSSEFNGSISQVDRNLKAMGSELKAVKARGVDYGNSLDGLGKKQDILKRSVEAANVKLTETRKKYDEMKASGQASEAQLERQAKKVNDAQAQFNRLESELKDVEVALKRQSSAWQQMGEKLQQAGTKLKSAGDSIKNAGNNLTMKVTAPIMGAATAATMVGTNFEAAMSKVAAISGATGDNLQSLEDKAREMGATTNKSASEAADALSYMALAGWDVDQMLGGIEPVLKLSAAGEIDLARASDLVTDSMSAMQLQVADLPGYLDMMARASQRANTDVDALMEAFLVAGGTMAQFNVPLEESTAVLGIMANRGFKGAEAGTALNAIFTNLTSGAGAAGTAMADLEISAFDAQGEFKGLESVLLEVKDRMAGMTDEQKAQYMSMIAGKEHLKTFGALMTGLGEEYGSFKSEVSNANGALNDMYGIMTNNLKGRFDEFKSALSEAGIAIFNNLQPHLEKMLSFLKGIVDAFNNLSPTMQNIILVVSGLAAAIGPLLVTVGALTASIGSIITVAGTLSGALAAAGGASTVFGGALAALTGPIGIAVGAIAGVGTALVALYKTNEDFRNKVQELWSKIKTMFQTTLNFINDNIVKPVMTEVMSFTQDILSKIQGFWDENGQFIMETVKLFTKIISEDIQRTMQFIKGIFETVWPVISGAVKIAWGIIEGATKTTIDIVLGVIQTFLKLFEGDWKGAFDSVAQIAKDIWNNIVETFESIDLYQIGKDIIQGLVDGIGSMASALKSKAVDLVKGFIGTTKNELDSHSPSRVFMQIGRDTIEGMIIGIDEKIPDIDSKMAQVVSSIAGKASALVAVGASLGKSFSSALSSNIKYSNDYVKSTALPGSSSNTVVKGKDGKYRTWEEHNKKYNSGGSSSGGSSSKGSSIGGVVGGAIGGPAGGAIGSAIGGAIGAIKDKLKKHDGGWVTGFSNAGNLFSGLRSDEVPAILQLGEFVMSRKMVSDSERAVSQLGAYATSNDNSRTVNQYITINSPQPTSPSENARKFKQASRQLALEW